MPPHFHYSHPYIDIEHFHHVAQSIAWPPDRPTDRTSAQDDHKTKQLSKVLTAHLLTKWPPELLAFRSLTDRLTDRRTDRPTIKKTIDRLFTKFKKNTPPKRQKSSENENHPKPV